MKLDNIFKKTNHTKIVLYYSAFLSCTFSIALYCSVLQYALVVGMSQVMLHKSVFVINYIAKGRKNDRPLWPRPGKAKSEKLVGIKGNMIQ